MVYNLYKTVAGKTVEDTADEHPPLQPVPASRQPGEDIHNWLERRGVLFTVLAFVAVAVGSIVENIPVVFVDEQVPKIAAVKPYTPLELEGRDIYVSEGCYVCHSQMIRPFRSETERYGPYSKAGEYVYDHPFQWGSKRTGPDLMREGGKRPNLWHFMHMYEPESVMYGSIMPKYPWLLTQDADFSDTKKKMEVLRKLGVPYTDEDIANADKTLQEQAKQIVEDLKANGVEKVDAYVSAYGGQDVDLSKKKIIALIAYLQRLGTDTTKKTETAQNLK